MTKPRISVVLPSYNHARYVDTCIAAFLRQTFQDFELIIIDDASSDDTVARIRSHDDPRITLLARPSNRGVAAGMNEGVSMAKADIVCFFATDDFPDPDYLAEVMRAFEREPAIAAAYFPLRKIMEDGSPMAQDCPLPSAAKRFAILRLSFMEGNQLPSPGMAIRRDAALKSKLPEGVCQYSDWMLNNRLLLLGEIALGEKPLLSYRVSPSSLSARSLGSQARDGLETRIMMDDFLQIRDTSVLVRMFPEEIGPYVKLPAPHIPYILGRMALLSPVGEKRSWGYETIMRHISEPTIAESLRQLAGFTYKDLMALTPTDSARSLMEIGELRVDVRRLRRRVLRLRLAFGLLACGLAAAAWMLFR
jgi:glycosyltransferase involved in cell wall biosynthesis